MIDAEKLADNLISISTRLITIDKSIAEDEEVKRQIDDFIKRPRILASFSPASLNFGTIKKSSKKEEHVILTPSGVEDVMISKAYSSGERVNASEWTRSPDGSYRIKVTIDAGNATGRVLETLSFKLSLPDEPVLNLLVFGNVVDE